MKSIKNWAHGLVSALIGGAASSISAGMIDPETFNVNDGLTNVLKLAAVSGIVTAAAFLKQSPLPQMNKNGG